MAVDQKRNGDHPIDHGFWSHCEIAWHRSHAWHRSYVECWWVAVLQDGKGEEVMRSAVFRSPRGRDRGAPNESHQALVCLAALEEALASEGWEPVEEPPDEWYALRFRRPRVPLRAPDGSPRGDRALIAIVEPPAEEAVPVESAEAVEVGPAEAVEAGPAEAVEAGPAEVVAIDAVAPPAPRPRARRRPTPKPVENREPEQPTVEHTEAEPPEAEPQGDEGSALRDLIMSYAGSFDSDLDVRRHYGGPGPQLEPDRFEQPFRRRRRR